VGASGQDGGGAAYFFERMGDGWSTPQRVAVSLPDERYFGSSVAISGDRAIISARSLTAGGAAYVFERIDGTWTETGKVAPSASPSHGFGASVAVEGDTVLVGDDVDGCGCRVAGRREGPPAALWASLLALLAARAARRTRTAS
jgi:hypothetical protein